MPTVVTIVALLLASKAHAQTDRITPVVKSPPLSEALGPTPVTGPIDAIYGLLAGPADQRVTYPARGRGDPQIIVDGLKPADTALCVSIRRAQGGYRANFRTSVPKGRGPVTVPFDSSDASRKKIALAAPKGVELAVAARANCAPDAPLLATSWSPSVSRGDYTLLVGASSLGLPAIRVDGGPVIDCQRLSQTLGVNQPSSNVYGFACRFTLKEARCRTDHPLKVLWFDGAEIGDEVAITVRHGCD